ncbi:glutaredoxin domain-containing protein [Metabacillus iocasae]|uniref:Glutaredoxin-like YruB-family protein n=1 Tax=Priestia iocasae TaxID=2291674 RepID=A0ABS2QVA5_9BACI|nr:glutaredoxin domain-containing protein [Metabacillus iocasae]MBM7703405.1 glutaredoxin-like YruB-family protein [Metabacillus iocasae]
MSKTVEVYTQPACPPCQVVKQFLTHYNVPFVEFDVSKDQSARNRMLNEFQSYSTPTVRVGSDIVKGFDLQQLEALLEL